MHIHLAIASDRNMEVGLHVALFTAMKFLDPDTFATIHLFSKDFFEQQLSRLHQTLMPYRDRYQLKQYDVAKLELGNGKGLHQNKMPYVILVAPNLVESDRLLFLDADLLIVTDLAQLFSYDLNEQIVAAVFEATVSKTWSQEAEILQKIGVPENAPYFNTGVVLFDAKKWRENKLTEKCFDIAERYSQELNTADQTVLNAVLWDKVTELPDRYNSRFFPGGWSITEEQLSDRICHFVGSPKPWDFCGEQLHNSYITFHHYLSQTALHNYKSYFDLSSHKLKRTLLLFRSYYCLIKSRLAKK